MTNHYVRHLIDSYTLEGMNSKERAEHMEYIKQLTKRELIESITDKLNIEIHTGKIQYLNQEFVQASINVVPVKVPKIDYLPPGTPIYETSMVPSITHQDAVQFGGDGHGFHQPTTRLVPNNNDIKVNKLTSHIEEIGNKIAELNDSLANSGSWISITEIKRISNTLVEIENLCFPKIALDKE